MKVRLTLRSSRAKKQEKGRKACDFRKKTLCFGLRASLA
jgi:hypothetical protein